MKSIEATFACQICKTTLPLSSFHKDKTKPSGHSRKCKECQRQRSADYRKKTDWAAYQRKRLEDATKRSNINAQQRAWIRRNPVVEQAYSAVKTALKSGCLVRPQECSKCKKACTPEAHHDDYEKPLDVVWLCKLCHEARHHQ